MLLSAQAVAAVAADTLDVTVLDNKGDPVPDVAVYVSYDFTPARRAPGTAVMDQRDTTFVPHILVVQKGTAVEFPNSDIVAHHVYSFSKPNDFVLPLYKGDPFDPVRFDHDGIVTLGCNIHDHMLAYIVVVDTDIFGVTDANGQFSAGPRSALRNARVHIWSPRIRDGDLTQAVPDGTSEVVFVLQKKLRPPHDSDSSAVQWSDY